jgi:hypothetical protein
MTDRYNALVVVMAQDIRSDDAEALINAIMMLRGVASVTPNVADMGGHIAKMQVRTEMKQKVFDALFKD